MHLAPMCSQHGTSVCLPHALSSSSAFGCRAFDLAMMERRRHRSGSSVRPVEHDPWLSESHMVQGYASLQQTQTLERDFLAAAFELLRGLEERRMDLVKRAIEAYLQCYRLVALCRLRERGQ